MAGLVTEELNKFGPFGKYNGVTTVAASSGKDFSQRWKNSEQYFHGRHTI